MPQLWRTRSNARSVSIWQAVCPLGQQMAELPLDSRLGRALLAAAQTGCSEEVATVVAMLSVQSVWFAGQGQAALAAAKAKSVPSPAELLAENSFIAFVHRIGEPASCLGNWCMWLISAPTRSVDSLLRREWHCAQDTKGLRLCRFAVGEGDLIAYLNVWEAWVGAGVGRPSWAHRHCLNHRTLLRAADIRSQLRSHLRCNVSSLLCTAPMRCSRRRSEYLSRG